jgi:hypothetical protein
MGLSTGVNKRLIRTRSCTDKHEPTHNRRTDKASNKSEVGRYHTAVKNRKPFEMEATPESAERALTPEEIVARDTTIKRWLELKSNLTFYKEHEAEARQKVATLLFPNPKKGTQRYDLGGGYKVKLVYGTIYTLGLPDASASVREQGEACFDAIEELGEVGKALAPRLIKFTPTLSETEYLALDLDDPTQKQIKEIIDGILITKPASPQLSFEELKPAK